MPSLPADPCSLDRCLRRADAALQRAFPPALAVWVTARVLNIEELPPTSHFAVRLAESEPPGREHSARVWHRDADRVIPGLRVLGAGSGVVLLAVQPRLIPGHGLQLVIRDCRAMPLPAAPIQLPLPAPVPEVDTHA